MSHFVYTKFTQALADSLGRELVRNSLNPWVLASASWGVPEEPASCGKGFQGAASGELFICAKKAGHKGKHRSADGSKSQLRADRKGRPGVETPLGTRFDDQPGWKPCVQVTCEPVQPLDEEHPKTLMEVLGDNAEAYATADEVRRSFTPIVPTQTVNFVNWDIQGFINPWRHVTPDQAECLTNLARPQEEEDPPRCGEPRLGTTARCKLPAGHTGTHISHDREGAYEWGAPQRCGPDDQPTCGKTCGSLRCDREAGHPWAHRDSHFQVSF
jgi:hypothetical protein